MTSQEARPCSDAGQSDAEFIQFNDPERFKSEISLTESWGGKARALWQERFKECAEYATDAEFLYTGIGKAPKENTEKPARVFETHTVVAKFVKLQERFGRVPKMLFLSASCANGDQLIALRGIAREYKKQGVEKIIVILTAFPHERQDDEFTNEITKEKVPEPVALMDTIDDLRAFGYIDGAICIQPHSMKMIEYALEKEFPILPINAFPKLVHEAHLEKIERLFSLGPDGGRSEDAKNLASLLHCAYGWARKVRDRITGEVIKMEILPKFLEYIKKNRCTVLICDDEIRRGQTIGMLINELLGYADGLEILAVKGFFATDKKTKISAVSYFVNSLVKKVYTTDAVAALSDDMYLIADKLVVVPIGGDTEHLADYLKHNFVPDDDPDWLRNPDKTGTLLELDIRMTTIHKETPS
jgi:phosphoribosylpyrophosphate synthetase